MKKIQTINEVQLHNENFLNYQGESYSHVLAIEQTIAELKNVNMAMAEEEVKIKELKTALTRTLNESTRQREKNQKLIDDFQKILQSSEISEN